MFKLVACLCFVLIFVDLASSSLREDAQKLLSELHSKIDPKLKEFDDDRDKWEKECHDIVRDFYVKAEKNVTKELKKFNDKLKVLKEKNEKCVEDKKSKIDALTPLGRSYTSCSDKTNYNINRYMEESPHLVLGFKDKSKTLDDRLEKCKNVEPCLERLIKYLKDQMKTFPSQVETHINNTKNYKKRVQKGLKSCFKLTKLKRACNKIIKNINACAA